MVGEGGLGFGSNIGTTGKTLIKLLIFVQKMQNGLLVSSKIVQEPIIWSKLPHRRKNAKFGYNINLLSSYPESFSFKASNASI